MRMLAEAACYSSHDSAGIPEVRKDGVRSLIPQRFNAVTSGSDANNVRSTVSSRLDITWRITYYNGRSFVQFHAIFHRRSFTCKSNQVGAYMIIRPITAHLEINIFIKLKR